MLEKTIDKIIRKYSMEDVESALILYFLDLHKKNIRNNVLIKQIIERDNHDIKSIIDLLKDGEIQIGKIEDLINVFELLIPTEDKKINGAFFTPKEITNFMSNDLIKSSKQKVCDPSCGCGAFLLASVKNMHSRFDKNVIEIIEKNIYGVDISDYSIRRAKILLSLFAILENEDKKDIKFNLKVANSLNSDWNKIFKSTGGGFDVVIGNPPYVKFQDLNNDLRSDLSNNWRTCLSGNYNLYFAFFELGVDIMNDRGVLAYITPNNYFTSLAGIGLRRFFTNNKLITRIIDFDHRKIFNAQTYTCITFLDKKINEHINYEKLDVSQPLDILNGLNYSKVKISDLNDKKWRLLKEKDRENIKKIETFGTSLGELFDIRTGIATCKDSVYFIEGKELKNSKYYIKKYNNKDFLIEKDVTKPIIKISDFKDQEGLNGNSRRIIFPYVKNSEKYEVLDPEILKEKYPKCYEYLLEAKDELQTRDKGKKKYPQWYSYARSQGLNFDGEKLTTPTFSSKPRFLIEQEKESLFCNGYAIFPKKSSSLFQNMGNLKLLQKILNSRLMDYYIKNTSVSIQGGYPCYQKNFIELFSIPEIKESDQKKIEEEANLEKIDILLESIYGLKLD